jgi:hypothetical protein
MYRNKFREDYIKETGNDLLFIKSSQQRYINWLEDKLNLALTIPASCEQLKEKEIPTFMFWMDCYNIRKIEHNKFTQENKIMSFQEVSQKYINEMINL